MLGPVRPPRALLVPLAVLALLPAVGACSDNSGTGEAVGRVSDLDRRLCVSGSDADQGRCFTSTAELRAGLSVNDCVLVEYRQGDDGRQSEATAVRPSDGC